MHKYGFLLIVYCLVCTFFFSQETYNNCMEAMELCPHKTYSVTNKKASKTVCSLCEDDFIFCFTPENSIWFQFTTNANGGKAIVSFSSLVFDTNSYYGNSLQTSILKAEVPCQADSYTPLGNCEANGANSFILSVDSLSPNTRYYIVVSGKMGSVYAAECTFDIAISGEAVERPKSSISFDNQSNTVCRNQTYTAMATIQNCPDNTSFKWYINNELAAETKMPVFQTSKLEDGAIITVETSCYKQCVEQVTVSTNPIKVIEFPLDAGSNLSLNLGEGVYLKGMTSAPQHVWSPNYNISDTLSLTPFVTPKQTTVYTLEAFMDGCTQLRYVTVYVATPLLIPTTFSPNDDGINDFWEIPEIEKYPNCFVRIFDRWGQEVFQTIGYSDKKAWDGRYKNGPVMEGVYFYTIDLRDEQNQAFKGSITLIR